MTHETVNHPAHYQQPPSGVECITIIEHFSYNIGAAVECLWRAGLKPGASEMDDLRKAAWHIQREIARLSPPEEPVTHPPVEDIHEQFRKRPSAYPPEICIPSAPAWANFYAEDASGDAWLYSNCPTPSVESWRRCDGKLLSCDPLNTDSDWRQSLRRVVRSEAAR